MLRHAEASNTRLLKVYLKGFAPDATHRRHITMIQRFVRTADLDKMLSEPFEAFTFSPAGTAAKKLKEWDLKP